MTLTLKEFHKYERDMRYHALEEQLGYYRGILVAVTIQRSAKKRNIN